MRIKMNDAMATPFIKGVARVSTMDLSSRLENQSFDKIEEDSRLNEEAHDLPALPKAKKSANSCGVGVNICNGCAFILGICSTIITVTIVAVENNKVNGFLGDHSNTNRSNTSSDITSGCILSGKYDKGAALPIVFQDTLNCNFVVFGTAALGGLSMLYMYGSCCRIVFSCACGLTAFSFVALIDFIVMLVSTLFALAIGVMINLGRKETCDAIKQTQGADHCKTIYILDSHEKRYDFDSWMNVAEMSAWATACIFALMTIMNMFFTFGFFFKCCKSKGRSVDENELDAFNRNFEDDDDEPMLDPTKNATAPQLVFEGEKQDHVSFPPYNTGGGREGFYGDNPWGEEAS